MPKINLTYEKLSKEIENGNIDPNKTTKVTFSLRYRDLVKFLKFRDENNKSISGMVRDGVFKLIKDFEKNNQPSITKSLEEKLIQERKLITKEVSEMLKDYNVKEGIGESPEAIEKLNSQIISLLKDLKSLKSNELSKYTGVDYKTIQQICEKSDLIVRDGGKWRLKQ